MRFILAFAMMPLLLPTAQAFEPVATPAVQPWVCGDWSKGEQSRTPPTLKLEDSRQICTTDADCDLVVNPCNTCWFAINQGAAPALRQMFAEEGRLIDCAEAPEAPKPGVTCSSGYCRPVTKMDAASACRLYGGTLYPNPTAPGQMKCDFGSNTGEP